MGSCSGSPTGAVPLPEPSCALGPERGIRGGPRRQRANRAGPRGGRCGGANARIVQLGQSAGPESTLTSGSIRLKELPILGHSNFVLSADELRSAYSEVAEHVAAGRIRIDVETFPLKRVADEWSAQAEGTKAVVLL